MQLAHRNQCYQDHSKPVAQNHLRLQLFFGIDLELSMLTGSIDGQPKMLWHAVHSDSAGRPAFSAAKVAPQSASQRFEVPNALVGILQRSLARRHPHGDTGHFLESRRMSTLSTHHDIIPSDSTWLKMIQSNRNCFKKKYSWRTALEWLEMTRNDSKWFNSCHNSRPPCASSHAWLLPWIHFHQIGWLQEHRLSSNAPGMCQGTKIQTLRWCQSDKVSKWQSDKVTSPKDPNPQPSPPAPAEAMPEAASG